MSAGPGNKNALKGAGPATSHLHIRVTPQDKAGWVKAAAGRKLAEWVVETLNARAWEDHRCQCGELLTGKAVLCDRRRGTVRPEAEKGNQRCRGSQRDAGNHVHCGESGMDRGPWSRHRFGSGRGTEGEEVKSGGSVLIARTERL